MSEVPLQGFAGKDVSGSKITDSGSGIQDPDPDPAGSGIPEAGFFFSSVLHSSLELGDTQVYGH